MKVKEIAINSFAKFIIGGVLFEKIKDIVLLYVESDLSGEKKREAALKDIIDIGTGFGKVLLNLGIELALLFLKEKGVIK